MRGKVTRVQRIQSNKRGPELRPLHPRTGVEPLSWAVPPLRLGSGSPGTFNLGTGPAGRRWKPAVEVMTFDIKGRH